MSLTPLGHRLLVKPEKIESVNKAFESAEQHGIYIPDEVKKKEQLAVDIGIVISLGSTAFKDYGGEPWCVPGDRVAYTRYGGKVINDPVDDENYIILNDEDVIVRYDSKES